MKKTLRKLANISLYILSTISNLLLVWMFISTVEIAFTNTENKKANDYNIFVLSDHIKSNINQAPEKPEKQIYSDTITEPDGDDDFDEDDDNIIKI